MKLQHPEIFSMCAACLCGEAEVFHHPRAKTFCLVSFRAKKEKDACKVASAFFSQERLPKKNYLP
jgi:hypothetical protein